jgi:hypothetical protein
MLTRELGDIALSNRIREFLEYGKHDQGTCEAVEHALVLYDKNRVNRNQLTHFLPTAGKEGVEFWRGKGPRLEADPIPNTVEDIRRVAAEITVARLYLGDLSNWLIARNADPVGLGGHFPLPDKPPLPERLWKPPPQDQSKRQPPR